LKLEAQEQFKHIAPIGFIQTATKSKLKFKNSKTLRKQDEQHEIQNRTQKLK